MMKWFGFTQYPTECWHFDFDDWENYDLMEMTFDELNKMQAIIQNKTK